MTDGGIARRTASRRIAAGALLPFAALGAGAAHARASVAETVPTGAFRLERVLTRGLSDGNAIVVTRRWRIGFASSGRGLSVAGGQVFAEVEAPPRLASLAELERTRAADGLFPVMLDAAGLIVASGKDDGQPQLVRAIDTARALFASLPLPAAEREDARTFMVHLASMGASAVSQLPRDLFYPRSGAESSTKLIPLPGGETGSIVVTANAVADDMTGLLVSSERRITTRFGEAELLSGERWSMGAFV